MCDNRTEASAINGPPKEYDNHSSHFYSKGENNVVGFFGIMM